MTVLVHCADNSQMIHYEEEVINYEDIIYPYSEWIFSIKSEGLWWELFTHIITYSPS